MIKKFITVSVVFILVYGLVTFGQIWFVYGGDILKFKHKMEPLTTPVDLSSVRFVDTEGKAHLFSELHGKTVLVMFWATWCKYCMRDMPSVATFIQDHAKPDDPIAVLPLAIPSDTPIGVKRFMEQYGNSIEGYVNQTPAIYKQLQMRGVPYYIVVNSSGSAIATIKPKWGADLVRLLTPAVQ